jgi:transcriptional regulator with XRE-family HTH domain
MVSSIIVPKSKKLSNFLKQKRLQSELSQQAVATFVGFTSSQMVSNWERGLCSPPMNTLVLLAELFNIPDNELFDILETEYRTTLRLCFSNLKKNLKKA